MSNWFYRKTLEQRLLEPLAGGPVPAALLCEELKRSRPEVKLGPLCRALVRLEEKGLVSAEEISGEKRWVLTSDGGVKAFRKQPGLKRWALGRSRL